MFVQVVGKALVVHAHGGERIACALIEEEGDDVSFAIVLGFTLVNLCIDIAMVLGFVFRHRRGATLQPQEVIIMYIYHVNFIYIWRGATLQPQGPQEEHPSPLQA